MRFEVIVSGAIGDVISVSEREDLLVWHLFYEVQEGFVGLSHISGAIVLLDESVVRNMASVQKRERKEEEEKEEEEEGERWGD